MRHIINEYGLVAIAVLCTLAFMFLWNYIVYGDSSLTFVYKTDRIYQNDLLSSDFDSDSFKSGVDSLNGILNTQDSANKPYFNLIDDSSDLYFIEATESATQEFTYDECLKMFSDNILTAQVYENGSYNTYNLYDSAIADKVEIVIVEQKPVAYTSSTSGDTIYKTSLQDIHDKYGNRVLDSNGNVIQSEQIVYNNKTYARSSTANVDLRSNKFIINNDIPCKYKVIYRITDDTLKAEYTAVFINKIRETGAVENDVYKEWFPDVNFGID